MAAVPETITYAKKISEKEYNEQKDVYTQKALKELNEQMKTFKTPQSNTPTLIKSSKKISLSLPNSDNDDNDDNDDKDDKDVKDYDTKDYNYDTKESYSKKNDSDSDYTDDTHTTKSNPSINFIIKHYANEQTPPQQQLLKKRKITNSNNSSTNTSQYSQPTHTMSDAIYAQHELDMEIISKLKVKNNTLKIENEDLDTKKHYLTLELSNSQCEVSDYKKQISHLMDENIKLKQYITNIRKINEKFELYAQFTFYLFVLVSILLIYVFYV